MKITINTIHGVPLNTSTNKKPGFIIQDWEVAYTVTFPPKQKTYVNGTLLLKSNESNNLSLPVAEIIKKIEEIWKEADIRLSNEEMK